MKLLTSTALSLLLISLASVSYGQAIETINYASGNVYVGEVRDSQYHGQGTYTYSDGAKYFGEFVNGKRNHRFELERHRLQIPTHNPQDHKK